jgi:hypothetical protein
VMSHLDTVLMRLRHPEYLPEGEGGRA